jgi:hypothetical protein
LWKHYFPGPDAAAVRCLDSPPRANSPRFTVGVSLKRITGVALDGMVATEFHCGFRLAGDGNGSNRCNNGKSHDRHFGSNSHERRHFQNDKLILCWSNNVRWTISTIPENFDETQNV